CCIVHRLQRRDVVEHPERPALCSRYEISILDREVGDRDHGQIELERLPPRAAVKRIVDAGFRASEQQTPTRGILPNRTDEAFVWNPRRDRLPRLAVVGRLED